MVGLLSSTRASAATLTDICAFTEAAKPYLPEILFPAAVPAEIQLVKNMSPMKEKVILFITMFPCEIDGMDRRLLLGVLRFNGPGQRELDDPGRPQPLLPPLIYYRSRRLT